MICRTSLLTRVQKMICLFGEMGPRDALALMYANITTKNIIIINIIIIIIIYYIIFYYNQSYYSVV